MLVASQRFLAKAEVAEGVVVDVATSVEREQRKSGDRTDYVDVTYFAPIVRFRDGREQVVQFQAGQRSSGQPAYRVGDSVRVLYDPANPQDARLDTVFGRWGAAMIFLGMGLLTWVLSAVVCHRELAALARRLLAVLIRRPSPGSR
jgi:hypothetical protein